MNSFEIVGHSYTISLLSKLAKRKNIPHSFLFTGHAGIGKSTVAALFATVLNCISTNTDYPCGECVSCIRMHNNNHPDFIFIEPSEGKNKVIPIDRIRELKHAMKYAPAAGKYRITIIKNAKYMNTEASNAFLKTLEEPPAGNILILTATDPADLLPTIVSRCQRLAFQLVPDEEIIQWLLKKFQIPLEEAIFIAKKAEGCPGRAVDLIKANYYKKHQSWLDYIINIKDITPDNILDMAESLASSTYEDGEVNDIFLSWEEWFRDILSVKINKDTEKNYDNIYPDSMKNHAIFYSFKDLTEKILLIDNARKELDGNRNSKLVIQNLLFRLQDDTRVSY